MTVKSMDHLNGDQKGMIDELHELNQRSNNLTEQIRVAHTEVDQLKVDLDEVTEHRQAAIARIKDAGISLSNL